MCDVLSAVFNLRAFGMRDTVTFESSGDRQSHIAQGRDCSQLRVEEGCWYEERRILDVFSIVGEWRRFPSNRAEGHSVNSEIGVDRQSHIV